VVLFLFIASPVWAFLTGNEMLQFCNETIKFLKDQNTHPDLTEATKCVAYLDGMIQLNTTYRSLFETPNTNLANLGFLGLFCPPTCLDRSQIVRIVVKYLTEHPEKLHEEAIELSVIALKDAFPCPNLNLITKIAK